jgi:hypothetical protein
MLGLVSLPVGADEDAYAEVHLYADGDQDDY